MDIAFENITKGLDTAFFVKNGGLLGGAALLTFFGLQTLKIGQDDYKVLQNYMSIDDYKLVKSSDWAEICFRMEMFAKLIPSAYQMFLQKIVAYLDFMKKHKGHPYSKSVSFPRLVRKYLHPIIEAVRMMRALLEKKYSNVYLSEFDDIAADVQTLHDTNSNTVFLDS
jgi:hypothetical protein